MHSTTVLRPLPQKYQNIDVRLSCKIGLRPSSFMIKTFYRVIFCKDFTSMNIFSCALITFIMSQPQWRNRWSRSWVSFFIRLKYWCNIGFLRKVMKPHYLTICWNFKHYHYVTGTCQLECLNSSKESIQAGSGPWVREHRSVVVMVHCCLVCLVVDTLVSNPGH